MKPRVIAIIQGRMSSSRLPGKILADIAVQDPAAFTHLAETAKGAAK